MWIAPDHTAPSSPALYGERGFVLYPPHHRPGVKIGDALHWSKLGAIRTITLVMLGFAALVYGAFILLPAAGFLVLGVALLLLAYLTDPGEARR